MTDWLYIALLALGAGLAMPLGAYIASIEHIKSDWLETELRYGVVAFGGGALLSAVALVLIPEGIANVSTLGASICFLGGGVSFFLLDIALNKSKSSMSQLVAMLSDFLPEAIALGATYSMKSSTALLLAGLMALQNLPEGFNSYRELKNSSKNSSKKIIFSFLLMAFLGPVSAITGFFFLNTSPMIISGLMLFAAGGILYLIFQDIAPQAKLEKHWAPPLGAVAGFMLGIIGKMITE